MKFVDSHCHLNLIEDNLSDVINRAIDAGVGRMVVPGIDLPSSVKALEIAEKYAPVYAAVGIHPHESSNASPADIMEISRIAAHPKVVAIGEIGLDYHYTPFDDSTQKSVLAAMLDLANSINKPVILHSRDSLSDLLNFITTWVKSQINSNQSPLFGVFHMFEGNSSEAIEVIQRGFLISVGGNITFKNNHKGHELVKAIGLNHLLLETDTPYISPHPFRGKANEPSRIPIIAEKVAELLGITGRISSRNNNLKRHISFQVGIINLVNLFTHSSINTKWHRCCRKIDAFAGRKLSP